MPTVLRKGGMRFMIYVDDHEPAHVHIFGQGELKVMIRGADGYPQMLSNIGFPIQERRRAMDIVLKNQSYLAACWEAIHGES